MALTNLTEYPIFILMRMRERNNTKIRINNKSNCTDKNHNIQVIVYTDSTKGEKRRRRKKLKGFAALTQLNYAKFQSAKIDGNLKARIKRV